jgi:hypothetical protein
LFLLVEAVVGSLMVLVQQEVLVDFKQELDYL